MAPRVLQPSEAFPAHPTNFVRVRRSFRTPVWFDISAYSIIAVAALAAVCFGKPMVLEGEGGSMHPTLKDGGRELALPLWLFYRHLVPERIYAFKDPEDLTGKKLCLKRAKVVWPDGQWVWFLGDNRNVDRDGKHASLDSQSSYGWVPRSKIVGVYITTIGRGKTFAQKMDVGYPGYPYPDATDLALLNTNEQLRVKQLEKSVLARVGDKCASAKFYGRMQESPNGAGIRGFHIDVPPAELHYLKFNCTPGANGVKPMVLKPQSGASAIPYEDGFLIRSHGDLRVECLMPFSLIDVITIK